jgi:hypothetical protein
MRSGHASYPYTMGASKSLRRIVATTTAGLILLTVAGCSNAYESYMADACDGLRAMATAYETKDREAFDEGYTEVWALDPAGEEAAGDKALRREVHRLWNAQRLLHIAAYEPAELNDGASVWRGLELSEQDRAEVRQGIDTCAQY